MSDHGHELVYPFAIPSLGEPVEVRPGLLWLRLRLPFALDHVNLWLADDGQDGWTLVDTGVADAPTRATWERLLGGLLGGRPIRRVLVTHFHPDHMGEAGWLCERTGAPLVAARTEWLMARSLAFDSGEGFLAAGERLDSEAGLDSALAAARRGRGNLYARNVSPPPARFERLAAGERIGFAGASWEAIVGEGHAPEQLTFFSAERGELLAADQILPKITPVIGVWPQQPDADPLGDYLRSLARYRDLPADVMVLPSHGRPFLGLRARLESLAAHHEERLSVALGLAATPSTAAEIMRGLFAHRQLGIADVGFALAETLAHLNRLLRSGEIERLPHADGAWRYARR